VVNPVLTADDVTDWGSVDFVADPFLFVTDSGGWHMFVEVYNSDRTPHTGIGHATSEDGSRSWTYDQVVLQTGSHLSFPYVFKWDGSHYLIPEEGGATAGSKLTLYEADDFPYGWSKRVDLVTPNHHTEDHLVFRWQSRWWAVIGDWSGGNDIYAYYSDELATPSWMPHEGNPIVSNRPEATRPAGRPIVRGDHITAFFQDCRETYGHKVRAYEITGLSPDSYKDQKRPESPVLEP
jgi:hypothetical protein